ncbi:MAG: DNA ligase [Candidatus Aenigmatarchaeota archaeon]|nr:MAG: DNA ligase [Candidatus Aenigmarchaeota archaeon]
MDYSKLTECYELLEKTSARLKKIEIVAKLLRESDSENLPRVTLLLQGKVFPSWSEKEIGIADQLMIKIISTSTGFSTEEINRKYKETGDLGLVVESVVKQRKQSTLFQKKLTVEMVFENLRRIAEVEGKGAQNRKFQLVSEILSSASPKEAKYIVRTVLGDLRIGVAAGIIRDSIAEAFFPEREKKEVVNLIEWAWFLRPDYGEIARIAKERGIEGLKKVRIEVGKPYHVLLAEKAPSLEEGLKKFENPSLEYKYDGARIIIHKKADKIWLFTRRLENVTKQFPDCIELVKRCVKAKECIIEGEMLAIEPETGEPKPFQLLSQRIKRKYNIEEMVKQIPVQVNLFEIVYLNGKLLFDKPLRERRKILESIIKPIKGKFQFSKQLVTKDLKKADNFYKSALKDKQEGVMIKNLDAKYQPGRRVGYWLKVKPTLETLDLAITGGIWGTGKRAGWLGSFILGCRNPDTGEFLECGMLGTGIKEKKTKPEDVTFEELTKILKPYIISEKEGTVKIQPKIVVEVAYEEIQKSPNYSSGFALRFPRFIRIRTDKGPDEADDIERIYRIFETQKGK